MALDLSTVLCSYPEDFFIHWKNDVVSVRQLHRERKYRRCAILCSELLKDAIHPIHKTFLHFYQAICYESLGHIAHNYSSNKIPLLEQARDAFILASETLPTPELNSINEKPAIFGCSPVCATLDIAALYDTPTPSSNYTIRTLQLAEDQDHRESCGPTPTLECHLPKTYSIPNFDDYSPSKGFHTTENSRNVRGQNLQTPNQHGPFIHNHKNRLSRSLSSKHALAEELVPSPLFSRGPSSRKESRPNSPEPISPTRRHQLTQVALCKPLPPLPPNRPLPHLPFNHNPQFIRKGKRFVVVPRRKTALSTLISKFEGKRPFNDTGSPYSDACSDSIAGSGSQGFGKTPVTERFNQISAVFVEKNDGRSRCHSKMLQQQQHSTQDTHIKNEDLDTEEDDTDSDKENIDPNTPGDPTKSYSSDLNLENRKSYPFNPATPCPRPKPKTKQESRSPSSSYYSTTSTASSSSSPAPLPILHPPSPSSSPVYLSTIQNHTSTYHHLLSTFPPLLTTHIRTITTTITNTQTLQHNHDLEKRARFAKTYAQAQSPCASSTSPTRTTKTKTKPLHSFWSLQVAAQEDKVSGGSSSGRTGAGGEAKDEAKKERIRRLKEGGWNVRKEKVGFKGMEYYGRLVGRVEADMEGGLEGRMC